MPELSLIRLRWDFLQGLHPLFLIAKSLPTVESADSDHFGPISVNDVDPLKNEITMLRSDLKLNIIKQQLFDIGQLVEGDSILGQLQLELDLLLEELEILVDHNIEAPDVSFELNSVATDFLSYFHATLRSII